MPTEIRLRQTTGWTFGEGTSAYTDLEEAKRKALVSILYPGDDGKEGNPLHEGVIDRIVANEDAVVAILSVKAVGRPKGKKKVNPATAAAALNVQLQDMKQ